MITPNLAPYAFVYLDDIVVATESLEEHLKKLKLVFDHLRKAKLKPNPDKCRFVHSSHHYLGHVINKDGLRTDPENL